MINIVLLDLLKNMIINIFYMYPCNYQQLFYHLNLRFFLGGEGVKRFDFY